MEIFVPVASGQGPGAKVGVAMAIIYTSSGTQYTGQDAGESPAPSGGVSNSGSLSSLGSAAVQQPTIPDVGTTVSPGAT